MKRILFLLVALGLFSLAAQSAIAADAAPTADKQATPDKFAKMDINSDGSISYEEFKTAFPSMREEAFTLIDTDKNKGIDRTEWDAFMKNHSSMGSKGSVGGKTTGECPAMPLVTPPTKK